MLQSQFSRQIFGGVNFIRRHQTFDLQPWLDRTRAMARDAAIRSDPDLVVRAGRNGEDLLRGQSLLGVEASENFLIRKQFDQPRVQRGYPDDFAEGVFRRGLARYE